MEEDKEPVVAGAVTMEERFGTKANTNSYEANNVKQARRQQFCWPYNSGEECDGSCGRKHKCAFNDGGSYCNQPHPLYLHSDS